MALSTEAPSFPNWTMEIMLALCRILGGLNAQMATKCLGQPQACRISGHRESPPALLALTSHHSEASRHNPHLIPWQGQGGRPLPEEDVGSSSPVGPSPSQATQSAHVSASGASGCERSPRKGQAEGQGGASQGAPATRRPPTGGPTHLREVPEGAGQGKLAVLLVHALPLADRAQVVVRADAALVAGPHHRPITTITDHVGVYHVSGHLLSTRGAMIPPALLLLCREGGEPETR